MNERDLSEMVRSLSVEEVAVEGVKQQEAAERQVAEMKTLWYYVRVMQIDRIRNENIRGMTHVRCFRKEARLSGL